MKMYFRFNDRDLIPVFNAVDSASFRQNILYLVYTNYDKPVDSFFLIGGLLATWTLMNALDKFEKVFGIWAPHELNFPSTFRKSVNIPRMYLHRYLRYTPTLAVLILFFVSFTKFMGNGPFFNPNTQNCERHWWTALLHITVYTNAFHPVKKNILQNE